MYSEQSKGYGLDFLRFSLNIYSQNDHINSNLFENFIRKLPPITNPPQIAKHAISRDVSHFINFQMHVNDTCIGT